MKNCFKDWSQSSSLGAVFNPITIAVSSAGYTETKKGKKKDTHARLESVVQASMLAGHGNDTDPLFGIHIPYAYEGLLLST